MASGFIDGVGYPMNGGLAVGFAYGQKMAEEKRRRGLASGFSNYINAEDEEGKKAALAQIAQNDPSAYVNLIKANKETTFGLGSAKGEYAYLTAMEQDPTIPEDLKVGIRKRKEVLEKAPIVSYTNAYGQQVGKQDAEAGLEPSYGYGTPVYTRPVIQQPIQGGDVLAHVPVREKPIQGEQPQAMPMQAQLMPRGRVTAASLAEDKRRAEKRAEEDVKYEAEKRKNAENAQRSSEFLADTIRMVENAPDEVFSPLSNVYQTAGVLTGGLVGFDSKEQAFKAEVKRRIGSLQNDILAEARAKGQTGINTMAEIKQATKGLDENSGKPALLATLRLLQKIKQDLAKMPDEEGVEQPQEEIIYYEDL
jgi:hypothetical protein